MCASRDRPRFDIWRTDHEQDHARSAPPENQPAAEQIRAAVLADQANGRAEAAAKIEAANAQKTAAEAPRAHRAPQARANMKRPASKAPKPLGKRAEILASAQAGVLPAPPDFTAETHRRFRPKLAEVVALVEAGDVAGLRAYQYVGFLSSSPRAIMRDRDLALVALEARAPKAA